MPYSKKQKRFACAEYSRAKRGQPKRSSLTKAQAKEMCTSPIKKKAGGNRGKRG